MRSLSGENEKDLSSVVVPETNVGHVSGMVIGTAAAAMVLCMVRLDVITMDIIFCKYLEHCCNGTLYSKIRFNISIDTIYTYILFNIYQKAIFNSFKFV